MIWSLICFNKTTPPHPLRNSLRIIHKHTKKKRSLYCTYGIKRKFYFSLALDYRAHLRKYINWPSTTLAVLDAGETKPRAYDTNRITAIYFVHEWILLHIMRTLLNCIFPCFFFAAAALVTIYNYTKNV